MNFLDAVLLAVFALAALDGARRGLASHLAEFLAIALSLAVAFLVFGPISLLAAGGLRLPAGAAAVGVFLLALAAAHGVAWPVLRRWSAALERRLPLVPGRRLGALPALGTAVTATALILGALVAIPGQTQFGPVVDGSALGSRLVRWTAPLPMGALLGAQKNPDQAILAGRQGDDEDAFYRLTFPAGLKLHVDAGAEQRMLIEVNAYRKQNGLAPLVMDPALREVARAHSRDMYQRDYFSHLTPDGRSAFARLQAGGIKFFAAGENIALAPDVDSAEGSLLGSPQHRANIVAPDYVRVGIGVISAPGYEEMFTQEFADAG